jgi:hypothetical protein
MRYLPEGDDWPEVGEAVAMGTFVGCGAVGIGSGAVGEGYVIVAGEVGPAGAVPLL